MFRRRIPLKRRSHLRALIWPRSGWHRATRYLGHRLGRLSAPPHRIAAGLACGIAASLTPLVGLHIALAALLTVAVRGNVLAALFGTLAGNPWTLPLFWLASHRVGLWLLPDAAGGGAVPPFVSMFANLTRALLTLDGSLFVEKVWPIWWPMMVGSLPLAVLAWIAAYLIGRVLIGGYQERSRQRRTRAAARGEPDQAA